MGFKRFMALFITMVSIVLLTVSSLLVSPSVAAVTSGGNVGLDTTKSLEDIIAPNQEALDKLVTNAFDLTDYVSDGNDDYLLDGVSASGIKSLIERFEAEGEFANSVAARALKTHMTAVELYEKQGNADKIVKHMNGFEVLLEHQKNDEVISGKAYQILQSYAVELVDKWDTAFSSERAMKHIHNLSVGIGPRVTGTAEERLGVDYIKNEFEKLGYDVSTQEFDIRGDLKSQNVIAVKKPEGIDNAEIIYVTSHHDSVRNSPGANDNGSGTSTILEMARAMQNQAVNKEVRFIAFGAEEIGLVGSTYYVSQLSQEEIGRSIANFNMDMVGTNWEPASQLYVNTVDGKSNIVWTSVDAAAKELNLPDNLLNLYQFSRSDHVPFHNVGIDAALFIWMEPGTARLEPYYHTPQDTIENVSPERIQIVGDILKSAVTELVAEQATDQVVTMQEAS